MEDLIPLDEAHRRLGSHAAISIRTIANRAKRLGCYRKMGKCEYILGRGWKNFLDEIPMEDEREPLTSEELIKAADLHASGWTYFIQAGEFIKIGSASSVAKRLRALQTAMPHTLQLLGVSRQLHERDARIKFEKYRVRGEWFQACPEIIEFIAKVGWSPRRHV